MGKSPQKAIYLLVAQRLETDLPAFAGRRLPPIAQLCGRYGVSTNTMAKAAAKKAPTKTELLNNLAEATDLSKKEVAAVLEALAAEIKKNLGSRGPGMFTIPGLVKIQKKKVPARPAKKGVPNPFKPGELMDVAAKPASTKVTIRALKNLKDMV